MSIEQEAQKDLALSDKDAENVAGGKKSRKTAHRATTASTAVQVITVSIPDTGTATAVEPTVPDACLPSSYPSTESDAPTT